jgi:hypothetical protein
VISTDILFLVVTSVEGTCACNLLFAFTLDLLFGVDHLCINRTITKMLGSSIYRLIGLYLCRREHLIYKDFFSSSIYCSFVHETHLCNS